MKIVLPFRRLSYFILLAVSFLTIHFQLSSFAHADGSSAGNILIQSLSAKAQGLAEMYSSVSADVGDITALQYNPASIAFLNRKEVSVTYKGGIFGDKLGVISYGNPLELGEKKWGVCAGTLLYYSVGETDFVDLGGVQKTVNAEKDYAFIFSYSNRLGNNLSVGANGKVLRSQLLEKFTATAFAMDIGSLYKMGTISLGGAIQNIGTGLRYDNRTEEIPVTFRAGVSHQKKYLNLHQVLFGVDVLKRRTENVKANLGFEYRYDDKLFPIAFRSGYKLGEDSGKVNFGLGFNAGSYKLDYSMQVIEENGNSHFLTLGFLFGQP
ncbi:MAG: PorV/PorQ family protein [Elusimicrobia bacterium]|nr:PorV/PorQ family protein [Elusimicrobiota bacterium]